MPTNPWATVLMAGLFALPASQTRAETPPAERGDVQRDTDLSGEAELSTLLRLALEHNPALRESAARTGQAEARAAAEGKLPDPQLRYQLWGAPLARPWDPEMHMLGVSQEVPAPGSLRLRAKAGREQALLSQALGRVRAEEVATEVKRAFFEYQRASNQLRIHEEHLLVVKRLVELTRASYQTGRATQQDVLRASVEVSRTEADLVAVRQELRSSRALLNTLMGREPDEPLGPPRHVAPPQTLLETTAAADARQRPEGAAAERAGARSEALLEAAEREARVPSLMLGADYMLSPMREEKHGFGVMVSLNLPWLGGRRKDEVRSARQTLAAEREAEQSTLDAAQYQVSDALERLGAARRALDILEGELLPTARRSYEASEASFVAGQGTVLELLDSERSWLQVRLDRERALAQLLNSLADLERASGAAAQPTGQAEGR